MENQALCNVCQINDIKWFCKDHKINICSECTFSAHRNCDKEEPQRRKCISKCQSCKTANFDIFCQDHNLQLCEICFYKDHQKCTALMQKQYSSKKDSILQNLKQNILPQLEQEAKTRNNEINDKFDSIVKCSKIVKENLSEINNFVTNFQNQQIAQFQIQIYQENALSINQLYIKQSYKQQEILQNKISSDLSKIHSQYQQLIEEIRSAKQSQLLSKEFMKQVVIEDTLKKNNQEIIEPECNYILPTNSSQAYGHSIIYSKKMKELYVMGRNDKGQLGIGNQEDQLKPVKLSKQFIDQKILQISCGGHHSFILTNSGLFGFGENDYGQLGDGTTTNKSQPINIIQQFKGEKPKVVCCGYWHTAVLTANDKLFMFGANMYAQLGDNSTTPRSVPVDITSNIIKNKTETNNNIQEVIKSVSAGYEHTMVLTNKSLYTMGTNEDGQLGIGSNQKGKFNFPVQINSYFDKVNEFYQVRCGYYHTIVLTDKGLYTFGKNDEGQLGNNTTEDSYSPINITKYFQGEKILSINCGYGYNIVQTDKNIYSFGYNGMGQLGDGTTNNQLVPIKITDQYKNQKIRQIVCLSNHNFIETEKGLYGTGWGSYGQFGTGDNKKNYYTPFQLDDFLN